MEARRAVIFANGQIGRKDFFKDFFLPNDYIICADGGLNNAEILGVTPHLIVGDFDSYKGKLKKYSCEIISFPREKDCTDTELALNFSKKITPSKIIIVGALGKRLDHALANIYLLTKGIEMGCDVILHDGYEEVRLIYNDFLLIDALPGEVISLIPLSPVVEGISTDGLKYKLENESLSLGETRGISNEVISLPVTVKIKSGFILLIRNFLNLDKTEESNYNR